MGPRNVFTVRVLGTKWVTQPEAGQSIQWLSYAGLCDTSWQVDGTRTGGAWARRGGGVARLPLNMDQGLWDSLDQQATDNINSDFMLFAQ